MFKKEGKAEELDSFIRSIRCEMIHIAKSDLVVNAWMSVVYKKWKICERILLDNSHFFHTFALS